tara:strand:+ start:29201 stop:29461 length:261 start_codon:yes stop_codon:yes gene_type:complete
MKNFVYKTLFVSLVIFILFHLTIGTKIRQIEENIDNFKSKENIEFVKNKIRKEMRSAIKKDKVLNDEDAKLIKQFLNKINKELDEN